MAPNGIEDRAGTTFTTRPMLEAGEASLKGQTMVACPTIFPALDKDSLGRAGVYFGGQLFIATSLRPRPVFWARASK